MPTALQRRTTSQLSFTLCPAPTLLLITTHHALIPYWLLVITRWKCDIAAPQNVAVLEKIRAHCRCGNSRITVSIDRAIYYHRCLSIAIAGHNRVEVYTWYIDSHNAGDNRSRNVFTDSHSLSTAIDLSSYPSIAIVEDNSFQPRLFSTFLMEQYVGDVTHR